MLRLGLHMHARNQVIFKSSLFLAEGGEDERGDQGRHVMRVLGGRLFAKQEFCLRLGQPLHDTAELLQVLHDLQEERERERNKKKIESVSNMLRGSG